MTSPIAWAARLTPAGRGAIASVLVRGPAAVEMVDRIFVPAAGVPMAEQAIGRIAFGHWGGEELIVCRTGHDRIEVHCHGGSAAVEAVLRSLEMHGAAIESWQDDARQTTADLLAAEAWQALAQAQTQRTALILLDQFHGALRREIEGIRQAAADGQLDAALHRLDAVLARWQPGRHLVEPFRVVVAGRPNVGKSSLVNRLLGYGRAITSSVPGTTRDILTARTALDGWPVELIDTAGLRDAADELEAQGIRRANAEIRRADLMVWVHDAEVKMSQGPDLDRAADTVFQVWNKADLVPAACRTLPADCYVSAASGEGLDRLAAEIGRRLVPTAPEPGCGVPFVERQVQALEIARRLLAKDAGAQVDECLSRLIFGDSKPGASQQYATADTPV